MNGLVTVGSWFALVQLPWQIRRSRGSSLGRLLGSHRPTGCNAETCEVGLYNAKEKGFATSEETAYHIGLAKMFASCFINALLSKGNAALPATLEDINGHIAAIFATNESVHLRAIKS